MRTTPSPLHGYSRANHAHTTNTPFFAFLAFDFVCARAMRLADLPRLMNDDLFGHEQFNISSSSFSLLITHEHGVFFMLMYRTFYLL
jgi:hypothetical protein